MTSGTMSAAGDLLAQFLTGQQAKVRSFLCSRLELAAAWSCVPCTAATAWVIDRIRAEADTLLIAHTQSRGKAPAAYDPLRTLRMFGFGLCWYGPYQYYWYNLLDYFMPLKSTANFLAKAS